MCDDIKAMKTEKLWKLTLSCVKLCIFMICFMSLSDFHFCQHCTCRLLCLLIRNTYTDPDWNSLPSHLKDADISYSEFRRSLKTFLFGQWDHGAVWTVLTAPSRNILTYLLTYLCTVQWFCIRSRWCFFLFSVPARTVESTAMWTTAVQL